MRRGRVHNLVHVAVRESKDVAVSKVIEGAKIVVQVLKGVNSLRCGRAGALQ